MTQASSVDKAEIAKFAKLSSKWWDTRGPLRTLHDINPVRLEFVKKYTALQGKSVIDIGCGGGVFSEALAKEGALVTGFDAEPDAIIAAKQHAQQSALDIRYEHHLIETFEHEPVEIVTCMEMLEHVSDPELVLNCASKLLKADGILFVSTINRTLKAYATVVIAAEYLLRLLPRQTHDYNKLIKPSELAAMARRAGLEILGVAGLKYNPLTGQASLRSSVDVNYFLAFRKG